jgi:hypothetical protein
MQRAETLSKRKKCGPGRARYKEWRHPMGSALSAHRFFGACCTALRRRCFGEVVEFTSIGVAPRVCGPL